MSREDKNTTKFYRARSHFREVEGERKGIRPKLLQQLLLDRCQFHFRVHHRHDLILTDHHFLGELHSHDLIFLPTIAVGSYELNRRKIKSIHWGTTSLPNFTISLHFSIPGCKLFFLSGIRCQPQPLHQRDRSNLYDQ